MSRRVQEDNAKAIAGVKERERERERERRMD
jgi:hypothetical protein